MLWNQTETAMQGVLVSRGPLSVLINAAELQFYHSGVWDPHFCDPSDLDHGSFLPLSPPPPPLLPRYQRMLSSTVSTAVLLVGYGTEKSIFSTKSFWLVKNRFEGDVAALYIRFVINPFLPKISTAGVRNGVRMDTSG